MNKMFGVVILIIVIILFGIWWVRDYKESDNETKNDKQVVLYIEKKPDFVMVEEK